MYKINSKSKNPILDQDHQWYKNANLFYFDGIIYTKGREIYNGLKDDWRMGIQQSQAMIVSRIHLK